MDQASLLREIMKKQQNHTGSVAILSTSEIQMAHSFLVLFSSYISKKIGKKIALMGVEETHLSFEEMIKQKKPLSVIRQTVSQDVSVYPGKLDFVSSIRTQPLYAQQFIDHIKEIEKDTNLLLYYAGEGLNSTTINLSLASSKPIILMKPTTKSFMEVSKMIKIFKNVNSHNQAAIVIDTDDSKIFEQQSKKIQEFCWSEFKYYIEPIGFLEINQIDSSEEINNFEEFKLDYLMNLTKSKIFSEAISNMTL